MTAIRLVGPGFVPGPLFLGRRCGEPATRRCHRAATAAAQDCASPPPVAIDNGSMLSAYLWIKAFHIVFVASWFAGLFYLPRLFVNLAMVPADSHAERERLLLMARKLYRFSTLLMVPALALGLILWLGYGVGRGSGWLHLKLLLVLATLGYHLHSRRLLGQFERMANVRSHRWYRVYNEASVLLFAATVVLVVVKPF
jgi:protoporphyrinogen IX oxidase